MANMDLIFWHAIAVFSYSAKSGSKIKLTAKGKTVDAKSILMIMSLGLTQGTELTISAEGDDAQAALDALTGLIKNKFGEE